jgi:ketosteroid isomerase-like protein
MAQTREQELMQFFSNFQQAAQNKDRAALGLLIHDDYILVGPTGDMVDKQNMLDDILSGRINWNDFARSDHRIRFHGDMAAWTSHFMIKGKREGQEISGQYRDTNTFVKQGTIWQLIASHITPIP